MPGERGYFLGHQRGEAALGAAVDLHHAAVGQIAAHRVLGAHDLARHTVEHLELLDVAGGVHIAGDARSLAAAVVLVDESAGIRKALRGFVDLLQPAQGLRRLGLRHAGSEGKHRAADLQNHLRGSWSCSETVRT